MIIYGSKANHIATELTQGKCDSCGTQGSVYLSVFHKYAHIFWIPFFPIGKTAVSQCQHCKKVSKLNEFSSATRMDYDNLKSQRKTPLWMFSGLALVAIFIVFTSYESSVNAKRNAARILAPMEGDIFEIKTEDNQYTLYKVARVEQDSVLIRFNEYQTNKSTGLIDLKRKGDASFSELMFPIAKKELKTMLEKGEIMDIERNK